VAVVATGDCPFINVFVGAGMSGAAQALFSAGEMGLGLSAAGHAVFWCKLKGSCKRTCEVCDTGFSVSLNMYMRRENRFSLASMLSWLVLIFCLM
jgi:hypothetical protein